MGDWICPRCSGPNSELTSICAYCGGTYNPAASGAAPQAETAQNSAQSSIPEGWTRFVDTWNGFSVACPPGWQVTFYRGRVSIRQDGSGLTSAYLLMGSNPPGAGAGQAAAFYAQQIQQSAPGAQARIEPGDPQHPERANLRYRTTKLDRAIEGRCTILAEGEKLLVMGFESPAELLQQYGPFAGPILSSFRPEQLAPRQRVVEPGEGAYMACIPPGWSCQARLDRNNAAGKGMLDFTAVGDPQGLHLVRVSLMSWSFQLGMGGGLMNFLSGGTALPYMPAVQFCHEWLAKNLAKVFPGHRPVEAVDRPDLARFAEVEIAEAGTPSKVSVAILTTEAQTPAGMIRQKAQVMTSIQNGAGYTAAPIWLGAIPCFYRAPVDEFANMEHILAGIADSVQEHPAFKQRERQLMNNYMQQGQQWRSSMSARTSQILSETSDIISKSYWDRQATYDRISHDRSNAILGVQDMVDSTGTVYSIPSGYDQYWTDPRGNIFGGDWMTQPGWDWTPMNPLGK